MSSSEDEAFEDRVAPSSVAMALLPATELPRIKEFTLYSSQAITLVVGDARKTVYNITVCPHTLRMASPVWSAMLDPARGWKESSANSITLEDDDPEALLLLLRIAHLRSNDIQPVTTFTMLLNIAVLSDKYDMAALVRPFLKNWIHATQNTFGLPLHEEWLFIAWVFGMVATYERLAMHLTRSIKLSANGGFITTKCMKGVDPQAPDLFGPPPRRLDTKIFLPPGSIDFFNTIRKDTIERIQKRCLEKVKYLSGLKASRKMEPYPLVIAGLLEGCRLSFDLEGSTQEQEHDQVLAAALLKGFRPFMSIDGSTPAPDSAYTSIDEFQSAVTFVIFHACPNRYATMKPFLRDGVPQNHLHARISCKISVELRGELADIIGTILSPVRSSDIKHMSMQRHKCGKCEVTVPRSAPAPVKAAQFCAWQAGRFG